MPALYKCTNCGDVSDQPKWVDDNTPASACCNAPVESVAMAHGDGCCCRDCDPSGLVQSYYARTGRVL